ncbi:KIN4A, partial [Symbiodinium pilosum]
EAFSVRANANGNASRRPLGGGLEILEGRGGSVVVPGLTVVKVSNLEQALEVLRIGTLSRTSGDNGFNASSSRSHAIFQVMLEQKQKPSPLSRPVARRVAKLNLVDLAGSEKLKPESTPVGTTLQELTCINLSLSTLGKCVSAIVRQKRTHVPYRDSKLTRLLQDALSGQSLAAMIVCISPLMSSLEETLSSLKFADRAKQAVPGKMEVMSRDQSKRGCSVAEAFAHLAVAWADLLAAYMQVPKKELQARVQELSVELQNERSQRQRLELLLQSRPPEEKPRRSKGQSLALPISARQSFEPRRRSSSSKLKWDIVKHLATQDVDLLTTALGLGEEDRVPQARRDMDSMHSSSSSASELDVPEVQEVPLDGLGPMPRSSEKFRARGKHVLAYLQRLAQQNAELQARMEALEGRQEKPARAASLGPEGSVRRRPGEELSPTPLPRDPEGLELQSTSQKEFCFEASPQRGSKETSPNLGSCSPACSAETCTPVPSPASLEQRRELLRKARDDNARVRAELRQQDNLDKGHYSDCDPLHSEVKKLQEARKLLRHRPE